MSAVLDDLKTGIEHLAHDAGHLVNWQTLERGAAVVSELEAELTRLGVDLGPVGAVTAALAELVTVLHDAATGAAPAGEGTTPARES